LGQPENRNNQEAGDRLPTVVELFPEIVNPKLDKRDKLPSCSAVEALERQEPFVNQVLATHSLAMLGSGAELRIYYAASSKERKIIILYISETLRKDGDVRDPYSIFTRLVLSGRFDEVFTKLGVRVPPRGANLRPPMFQ
jgi:hypothetical protein